MSPDQTRTHPTSRNESGEVIPSRRMPPQALDAEVCVLGSMALDRESIGELIPILRDEHFYRHDHKLIFQSLINLYENNKPIDLVLLRDDLDSHGLLEQVGGVEYLVSLTESVPSAANAVYYAKIVRDKAMLRNLITVTGEIGSKAYEARGDVGEVLEEAEQKIFEVTQQKITGQAVAIKEILSQVYALIQQREGKNITGLATGYQELDEIMSGLQRNELIIVAARPSMGKTALGLNIAEYVGADSKKPVAIFSLEMSLQQLTERMLAGRSQIDSHTLRKGILGDEGYKQLAITAGDLSQAPIYIDDSPSLSPLELRAKARRLKLKHDIQLVLVDYLQLMHAPGVESRVQEVGLISRHLKALARELNVPVIAMSQLNRSPEGREGHRPRMSDLRESGNIEQDADVIIMLHRESYYKNTASMEINETGQAISDGGAVEENVAELIIAKQRNGPTGTVKLTWIPKWTRFENLSKVPAPFGI